MNLLLSFIDNFVRLYTILIFIRIVFSWLRVSPYASNPFQKIIFDVVDPYLHFFRRLIPPFGMIDFSPILALFALQIAGGWIQSLIIRFMI